jgi:hypothetical protein
MSELARRGLVPELLRRAQDPEVFGRWAEQVAGTGYCQHPIRLSGQQSRVDTGTGEVTTVLDTASEPDGVLLVACQNRRATVCPSCAKTYQADAWHLLSAGLRGGKGVPATVATHPCVFATLTAPSFGPVHSRRLDRRGRARRCQPRPHPDSDLLGYCPHGRPSTCMVKHPAGDPLLGQALCEDCFDYRTAVLFNCHITALWQNTVLRTRRSLAATLGIPVRQLADRVKVSFGKVAEYQLRGVVHLHVLVRLDGPTPDVPPPDSVTTEQLQQAVTAAARQARVKLPGDLGLLGWGAQLDVDPLPRSRDGSLQPAVAKVVGYLAKYATKSTHTSGALDRPIRRACEIQSLQVNAHLQRMVATCWQLGADPTFRSLRLRAWAHTLGFRGHLTTKSRTYSTTFTALRDARRTHRNPEATQPSPEMTEQLGTLRYAGRGYTTPGDALLAATARQQRDDTRQAARMERRTRGHAEDLG